ncbi:MAG TPA: tRNA (adenosine(37)-N6)-threonylcarbamoyltransferase complex transferase subunit TsaD [Opitutaceae bacterium]|nr:tRNA (adenosine(37)-N6)-threonylcarbamoyltransferase complex transferase subunit TsaD [Opitutaceae bacterium]
MILALESSCDETAVALFDPRYGLRGEWISSQIALHEKYGGVVPDLATREHLQTFVPLLAEARQASSDWRDLTQIAVTQGPGLAGCLAMGVAAAKSLAWGLGLPLTGINHLRGHAFSPFLPLHAEDPERFAQRWKEWLPHLGLIVSGGNTLLFTLDEALRITLLSSTRDDAAGEALDKGAKLLGLGYPGGPLIEKTALSGDAEAFPFPRGIGQRDELDFSFSGLKTSLRYRLEKMTTEDVSRRLPDLCASYQQAVIDALVKKAGAALRAGDYRSLGLSGGVGNNRTLRAELEKVGKHFGLPLLAALPRHTGDNAGMIAFTAWVDPQVQAGPLADLTIAPSLPLTAPA